MDSVKEDMEHRFNIIYTEPQKKRYKEVYCIIL